MSKNDWTFLLYFFALCSCHMIPNVSNNAQRDRQLTESNSASFGWQSVRKSAGETKCHLDKNETFSLICQHLCLVNVWLSAGQLSLNSAHTRDSGFPLFLTPLLSLMLCFMGNQIHFPFSSSRQSKSRNVNAQQWRERCFGRGDKREYEINSLFNRKL